MKNLSTLIIFVFSTATLFAQAPQSFNYQGVARTLDGNPVLNQNISLQISILETNANGAAVYTETHSVQTNNLGLFNLQIGMGIALSGTFSDINWGGDNHFVQIEMDENGGSDFQMIGTSQLLSVPYALYAGNGSLWKNINEMPNQYGFSSGAFYKVDNSSIIIGKQSENDLPYPSFPRLSMYEEYTDTQFGSYAGASMLLIRKAEYHDEPTLEFAYGYAQGTDRNFSFKTNGSSKLFIEGTGNIGIGTVEPEARLEIIGDGTSNRQLLVKNEGPFFNSHTYISAVNATDQPDASAIFEGKKSRGTLNTKLDVQTGDRVTAFIGNAFINGDYRANASISMFAGDLISDNSYSSYISFKTTDSNETSRTERMRIAENGNIGIGTASPKSKLQITDGDVYIEDINKGVIMKSPNGQCWRLTMDNSGQLESSAITCPN